MAKASGSASVLGASDMIYDYTCTPCDEENRNSEAKFYCKNCSKLYCSACKIFHDRILKGHVILGHKDAQKWGAVKKTATTEMCQIHSDKELEMFCAEHDEICCLLCLGLEHRTCPGVKHLPDAAKGIFQNGDFKRFPVHLRKIITDLNGMKDNCQENRKDLQASYKHTMSTITKIRKHINKLLDKIEKRTIAKMDRFLADFNSRIQSKLDSIDTYLADMKKLLGDIDRKTMQNESSAFLRYKTGKKKVAEAATFREEMKDPNYQMKFIADKDIEQTLSKLSTLGKFETTPLIYAVRKKVSYSAREKTDEEQCLISGICLLPNGNLAIVDNGNNKVKLLNKDYAIISSHCLPEHPRQVCHIADGEVAVSVNKDDKDRHDIHFISTSNDSVTLNRVIHLDHECSAISISNVTDRVYIGASDAIYIYTLAWRMVKKIYEDLSSAWFCTVERFTLSDDGRRIYLTNFAEDSIITLDEHGNKLNAIVDSGLIRPGGVCVGGNETVFVSAFLSNNVIQVDRNGQRKLATISTATDGVDMPTSVHFTQSKCQLIVGQRNDTINVFDLK